MLFVLDRNCGGNFDGVATKEMAPTDLVKDSRSGDHSFKARLSSTDTSCNPDLFRRFIFKAVFDCRSKLVSTASVDTFTKVISSRRSEVFRAKLYPNKHDEKDYNRFIEKYAKEILFWKVAEKVWVYAIPPFVLSQLDTRMRIVLVKQG